MRISILLVLLFTFFQSAQGQSDSTATKSGEIIDGEIVIEKEKKITLPKANKVFKKADLKSFDSEPLKLDFDIFQPTFDWPAYKSAVPFRKISKEYPVAPFQNSIKVGFGNYASPLIEAVASRNLEKVKLRANVFHESFARGPINDEFSRSSRSEFNFSGKYQSKAIMAMPYLKVKNDQYNFYGNTDRSNTGFSNENPGEVRYNSLALGAIVRGGRKSLKYYINTEVANTFQRMKDASDINKEPYFSSFAGISTKIDTSFSTGFDVKAHYSSYETGISYSRSLIQASPWIGYQKGDLSLKAGFRVASNESMNIKESGFYPFVDLDVQIGPDWNVTGFLDGGVDWNSLDLLISQNQFLDDSLIVLNTETNFQLGGGIQGSPIENLELEMEASYSLISNLPFFVPSSQDSARFILVYDDNIERINFVLGAEYAPNSISTYKARLEFANYTLNNLDEPWHLPTFQMSLGTVHNINQKVIFSTNFISLFGIEAPSNNNFGRETLKPIVDVNLDVKYLITNRSSLFFSANNLLNNEYERYIGYPVRGATFKVGGKYRF